MITTPLGNETRAFVLETRLGHKYLVLAPTLQEALLLQEKWWRQKAGGEGAYWRGITAINELPCTAMIEQSHLPADAFVPDRKEEGADV